ncbi:MAG: aquaporin family protein [Armatimonadetes bacterium]|nr:aquaporin family protein [Armatimonadota bacterium]
MTRRLRAELLAEVIGTYILCFFGPGAVAVAVLKGGLEGGWQVASVWGFAIALAIYAVGGVSGCHINPAVSIAMAVYRPAQFPRRKILPYIGAQMVGGMLAALTLAALFLPTCAAFEAAHSLTRGQAGSQLSGMWFASYFPNAELYGTGADAFRQVPVATAFAGELIGTAFLLFFVFALTDSTNPLSPAVSRLEPLFIGFTVAIVIAVLGPLTQAALNPARDLAPRIVEYFLGWGRIAIPGPRGCEWWLYLVAPICGGLVGAGIYETLRRAAREED